MGRRGMVSLFLTTKGLGGGVLLVRDGLGVGL